jgi:hypothetical protein
MTRFWYGVLPRAGAFFEGGFVEGGI